ncbi:MAG: glycosyl transferase [Pusillimonas sp.]|nr:glycosyl transferase [Pusillimonas sp.]MBC42017.1 glycosyl transferase [Pusillimonas sp.]|tara:strand:- start:3880 stop:4938 length:1059 start_codon:yes stop_codon:yes gene_type:complete
MRVLHLNFERGWRGGERQTLLCLRQLRKQGHDAHLLARAGEPLAKAARAEGFKVHEARNVPAACFRLLGLGRRFDILHAQTANTLSWLTVLKPLLGRPVVFTRRTSFLLKPSRQPRTLMKWERVDAFVAISEAAAFEPRRFGLVVSVIRSAIEPAAPNAEKVAALKQRFNLQGRQVVGTSAALTREKDPLTLIRAIDHLRETHPNVVCLHFGAEGDVAQAAKQLVNELDLTQHYLFAGFESGVETLFGAFDVFVLSSVEEALGSSVLDAFSQKVPVVATRAGGLKESLADERGLLVDVGDFRAMAASLVQVLDSPDLRAGLTRHAYDYVVREHNVDTMGERYLALYESVLEQ